MAKEIDRLVAAWEAVGEVLARVDRRRMVRLLEAAQDVASAHGSEASPLALMSRFPIDLEASADAC